MRNLPPKTLQLQTDRWLQLQMPTPLLPSHFPMRAIPLTKTTKLFSMFGGLNDPSAIGNSSFSDGDISVHPPFKSKHFVWNCTIDGPTVELPIKISTLIDNGAHMVLIHLQLVSQLKLPIFELPQPELIDVSMSSSTTKQFSLTTYVKLRVTSLDSQWTSRVVYAIIAPRLCMPVVLGLPFLETNFIVCDHKDRSCIDKKTNYNLLHPIPKKSQPTPKLPLKQQLKINKQLKVAALKELVLTVKEKWLSKPNPDEIISPPNYIAAIKGQITSIINAQILNRKEAKIRQEFKSDPTFR